MNLLFYTSFAQELEKLALKKITPSLKSALARKQRPVWTRARHAPTEARSAYRDFGPKKLKWNPSAGPTSRTGAKRPDMQPKSAVKLG